MRRVSTVLILISCGVLTLGQLLAGSQCSVQNSQGVCKLAPECPKVIDDLKNGKPYIRCGFEGRTEIVCCPEDTSQRTGVPDNASPTFSRISEQKCDEYKAAVYEIITFVGFTSDAKPRVKKIDKCGRVQFIVGGTPARPREFPHMALVGFDTGEAEPHWGCGGTLISEEYVLTAGHCLNTKLYGSPKYVRLGELILNTTDDDAKEENYNISSIIAHPEYKPPSRYNDIALLKLHRKVKINPWIRPACLPTTFEIGEPSAIATGWGRLKFNGEPSAELQKVTLNEFQQNECKAAYKYEIDRKLRYGIVPETQLCAGSHDEKKDTCQGDSGGPLQVFHRQHYCMYTVIGVTSFGVPCATIGTPGIYTRVYSYIDWIEGIVWANSS